MKDWKYEIGDRVTFIMGGIRHMEGTIFNRFAATELIPEHRYAIYYGRKERTTVIAETLLNKGGK